MFRIVFFMFLALLSGCATHSLLPAKPLTSLDLSETQGILIGSFVRVPSQPKYTTQTFYFKNIETGKQHKIEMRLKFDPMYGKTPEDIMTTDTQGGIFTFALPAGDYAFTNFKLYSEGMVSEILRSKQDYNIPFTVHPNKVNYVGEIKLTTGSRVGMARLVPVGGVWFIDNKLERDKKIISYKLPNFPLDEVVNVVPTEKKIDTPLVILPNGTKKRDATNMVESESPITVAEGR